VQIVEVTADDRAAAVALLAQGLLARFGADLAADFAASLCNHWADIFIAMHHSEEDRAIRETFRTLRRRNGQKPQRVFSFAETEGEEPCETVDLAPFAHADSGGRDPI
jgi:hypothetical protein